MCVCVCVFSVAQSYLTLCDPMDCSSTGSSVQGIFHGKNSDVGCHFLLQGIFPNQGSNPCLSCLWHWQVGSLPPAPPESERCSVLSDSLWPHGLYILQARILEWVAFPFCRRSSQPRDQIRFPTLEADSLSAKPPGKPKNTGVGSLSLLQQIFPTQEIKPRSPTLQVDSLPAEAPGKPLLRHENQISSF